MKATLLAVLGIFASAGCGTSPSAPSPAPPAGGGVVLTGIVYSLETTGRRPLAGATVEITEAGWGDYSRPTTDAAGRYAFGSLPARHYLARASKAGYDASAVVNLGFLDRSRSQDFELTAAGSTGPLAIGAINPNTGTTGGSTTVQITGSGFHSGTTVTFGGERANVSYLSGSIIWLTTPVHAAAAVDVTVTRRDGESTTLPRAFTYAAPQSFDFNGTWEGYALAHPESGSRLTALHSDMEMRFTIRDNVLTSFTCGGATLPALSPPPAVTNGQFSLVANGVEIFGRIVSAGSAIGTIDTSSCPGTRWEAGRR